MRWECCNDEDTFLCEPPLQMTHTRTTASEARDKLLPSAALDALVVLSVTCRDRILASLALNQVQE